MPWRSTLLVLLLSMEITIPESGYVDVNVLGCFAVSCIRFSTEHQRGSVQYVIGFEKQPTSRRTRIAAMGSNSRSCPYIGNTNLSFKTCISQQWKQLETQNKVQ